MFTSEFIKVKTPLDLGKLEIQYNERFQTEKEKEFSYNPFKVKHFQNYSPLFQYIKLPDDVSPPLTYEEVVWNHRRHFKNLDTVVAADNETEEHVPIHIKHSPLLDPVHYLIGKYKFPIESIELPKTTKDECTQTNDVQKNKIADINNASYVDGFFNFLSSQLLNTHSFMHGIDFYGSYLAVQDKFKIDLLDDYDYLSASRHFNSSNGKLYELENKDVVQKMYIEKGDTHSRRPKLIIDDDNDTVNDIIDMDMGVYDIIDESDMDSVFPVLVSPVETAESSELELLYSTVKDKGKNTIDNDYDSDSSSDNSDNNSLVSDSTDDDDNDNDDGEKNDNTTKSEDEENDNEDEDDEESDDEEEEEEPINAYIYNFPVQMICIEKCENTLDYLLEKDELNLQEQSSALTQIIFSLLVYQNAFKFTHNDLHTNNIVYSKTNVTHFEYIYNNKKYLVPTYGKIYKIIDFGRSIYTYRNKIHCSDSFAKGGDAYSQYNSEPYFDENKPRIEPNMSFDLCRLACSLYDFFFDEEVYTALCTNIDGMNVVQYAVLRWCTDDRGKNILYKTSSGEERYPNFKLYKMIARHVHNCTPEDELTKDLVKQYLVTKKGKKKKTQQIQTINIDNIPCYC